MEHVSLPVEDVGVHKAGMSSGGKFALIWLKYFAKVLYIIIENPQMSGIPFSENIIIIVTHYKQQLDHQHLDRLLLKLSTLCKNKSRTICRK